jgi:hypothetical protein
MAETKKIEISSKGILSCDGALPAIEYNDTNTLQALGKLLDGDKPEYQTKETTIEIVEVGVREGYDINRTINVRRTFANSIVRTRIQELKDVVGRLTMPKELAFMKQKEYVKGKAEQTHRLDIKYGLRQNVSLG